MEKFLITALVITMMSEALMPQNQAERLANSMSIRELLHEYDLIEKKQSKLTRSQRAFVVFKVDYLIEEGYLAKIAA